MDAWAYDYKLMHIFTDPGKPTKNVYIESFHGKLRDECLNQPWFKNLTKAKKII
jgi:putative transposase